MDLQNLLEDEVKVVDKKTNQKFKIVEKFFNIKKEEYLEKKYNFLLKYLFYLIILFLLIFLYRALYLQVFKYSQYQNLSEKNYLRNNIIFPDRGLIFDRNNEFLVKNIPFFTVHINIDKCLQREGVNYSYSVCEEELTRLVSYLEFDKNTYLQKFKPGRIILVKKNLTKENVEKLLLDLDKFTSIEVSIVPVRDYRYPESFSHILGYVAESDNFDQKYEGKDGVEMYYDSVLSGIKGYSQNKYDSFNNLLNNYAVVSPVAGKNIKLSVDASLQNYIYDKLSQKVVNTPNSTGGSVIVQNPQTGEILALVNYPSYDIQKFSIGISTEDYQKLTANPGKPFFNRAVSGVYPPGSVFKLVTASGILQEGVTNSTETIFDEGFIKIGNYRFNNWKLTGHGVVDVTKAMKVSNDTFFYIYTGGFEGKKGLGIQNLNNWALKFNFSKYTNIDLKGEAKGYMPDGKSRVWYVGDTFITAIGQGDVLATPLQVSTLTSYFAANQKAYKPYLVSEIDNKERKKTILYENLLTEENYLVIKNSLKEVNSSGGTAYSFFDFKDIWGFESGGKTGTSEFLKNGQMKTHAWYSGFAPLDNSEIVVTVFLEDGGGGSTDAAPLARDIMDFYFKQKKNSAK